MPKFAPLARDRDESDFPLRIVLGYVAAALVAHLVLQYAAQGPRPRLTALGALLWLLAGLALLVAVSLWRDDDTLAAGAIVGGTVVVGGSVAAALAAALLHGSIGAAALIFMTQLLPMVLALVIAVPVGALLVWFTRVAGDAMRVGPRSRRRQDEK